MKCPDCGTELHGKDRCSKCGKKIELPQKDVEVEYKEFTLSEFLEIRKRADVSGSDADTSTPPEETKQQKAFHETAGKIALPAKASEIKAEQANTEKKDKKLFPAVMIFLLVAVFIAAAFFLIKFLFRP